MRKEFSFLTASFLLFSTVRAQQSSTGVHPSPAEEPEIDVPFIKSCCEKVERDKRRIYYLNTRIFRMSMQLKGIYARDEMLFFRLHLANHSHLDYDVDGIRFFIMDVPHAKNSLIGVRMVSPLYSYGNTRVIGGKSQQENIFVLPRFTLPPGKVLMIEASEKNGGRKLQLRTDNFTLLRSRLV